jgi:hypothetical protein
LVERGVNRVAVTSIKGELDVARRIGELIAAMTDIEHLDVCHCGSLTCESLAEAIQPTRLDALKILNMAFRDSASAEFLNVLAGCCPNVEDLDLSQCLNSKTGTGWPTAIHRFTRLRHLNLYFCGAVHSESIKQLVTSPSTPPLETLRLGSCDLTDEDVGIIANGLPHLKTLSMTECSKLTALSCDHLSRLRLEELLIGGSSSSYGDDTFRRLSKGFVLLKHIKRLEIRDEVMKDENVRLMSLR